jgi:hypothetical protein
MIISAMKDFLNSKLEFIGFKKFKYIAPILCIVSDVLWLFYINALIQGPTFLRPLISNAIKLQGISYNQLSPDYLNMLEGALRSSFSLMLWCFFLYHLIIYFLSLTKLKWPRTYIKGYAFSAVILSVIPIFAPLFSSIQWDGTTSLLNIVTGLFYFVAYYGTKYFQKTRE